MNGDGEPSDSSTERARAPSVRVAAVSTDDTAGRARPRTLPGATVLQIVPALVEDHHARMAADTAFALLR